MGEIGVMADRNRDQGTEFRRTTEAKIHARSDSIMAAAGVLVGMVRGAERSEEARSTQAELSLEVELTGGDVETWKITIERTASSH